MSDRTPEQIADEAIAKAGIGKSDKKARRHNTNGFDKRIAELAQMGDLSYQRERVPEAAKLEIGVGALDSLVRKARAKASQEAAEPPHWKVEPSKVAIDGAELLDKIKTVLCRYIVLPQGAAEALALWTLHAWTFDAGDISPFMVLVSPTKRCGKTSVLILLLYLTPRSELASNISPSALFRYIEASRPTLLIDEADSFVKDSEEMRGILNSGHTKVAARVIRNVEVNGEHQPRPFSTWAPKAIASIRAMADTLEDRAVVVPLQRKPKTASVARLRRRDSDELATLRSQAARWAADNFAKLTDPDPSIPDALNDRAADNWRPLLAIADLAGGEWPAEARRAACLLSGEVRDGAIGVELLRDIRAAFGDAGVMRSADLVTKLAADPERPWAEYNRGNPITQRQLSRLLGGFHIISTNVRLPGEQGKGYRQADFEEAWAAYCSGQNDLGASFQPFDPSHRPKADEMGTTRDFSSVPKGSWDGSKTGNLSYSHAGWDAGTDRKPENGAKGSFDQEIAPEMDDFLDPLEAVPVCSQCNAPGDDRGGLIPYGDNGKRVWLHAICVPFWLRWDKSESNWGEPPPRTAQ